MRILHIHPGMHVLGGGERFAMYCVDVALRQGHEIVFVSEDFDTRECEVFFGFQGLFDKIDLVTFPRFRTSIPWLLLYRRLLYYQRSATKRLRQQKRFDLILSTRDIGFVPRSKSPVLQYSHFAELLTHLESKTSPAWRPYYLPARLYYRKRARTVNKLFTNSYFSRNEIFRRWGRDAGVLYAPIPVELYKSGVGKDDLIVTVGRVSPEKRLEIFVQIARRLPNYQFLVVGSVSDRNAWYYDRLRATAPNNASFALSLPFLKVRDVLARAKVYVHCMENEHFGVTVVEAMAAGCIPVVHDSGGPREIVTPETGFKWHSIDQASVFVDRIVRDEGLRKRVSAAASQRAKFFSSEAFESRFSNILQGYSS